MKHPFWRQAVAVALTTSLPLIPLSPLRIQSAPALPDIRRFGAEALEAPILGAHRVLGHIWFSQQLTQSWARIPDDEVDSLLKACCTFGGAVAVNLKRSIADYLHPAVAEESIASERVNRFLADLRKLSPVASTGLEHLLANPARLADLEQGLRTLQTIVHGMPEAATLLKYRFVITVAETPMLDGGVVMAHQGRAFFRRGTIYIPLAVLHYAARDPEGFADLLRHEDFHLRGNPEGPLRFHIGAHYFSSEAEYQALQRFDRGFQRYAIEQLSQSASHLTLLRALARTLTLRMLGHVQQVRIEVKDLQGRTNFLFSICEDLKPELTVVTLAAAVDRAIGPKAEENARYSFAVRSGAAFLPDFETLTMIGHAYELDDIPRQPETSVQEAVITVEASSLATPAPAADPQHPEDDAARRRLVAHDNELPVYMPLQGLRQIERLLMDMLQPELMTEIAIVRGISALMRELEEFIALAQSDGVRAKHVHGFLNGVALLATALTDAAKHHIRRLLETTAFPNGTNAARSMENYLKHPPPGMTESQNLLTIADVLRDWIAEERTAMARLLALTLQHAESIIGFFLRALPFAYMATVHTDEPQLLVGVRTPDGRLYAVDVPSGRYVNVDDPTDRFEFSRHDADAAALTLFTLPSSESPWRLEPDKIRAAAGRQAARSEDAHPLSAVAASIRRGALVGAFGKRVAPDEFLTLFSATDGEPALIANIGLAHCLGLLGQQVILAVPYALDLQEEMEETHHLRELITRVAGWFMMTYGEFTEATLHAFAAQVGVNRIAGLREDLAPERLAPYLRLKKILTLYVYSGMDAPWSDYTEALVRAGWRVLVERPAPVIYAAQNKGMRARLLRIAP